jgi:hypothetical protein
MWTASSDHLLEPLTVGPRTPHGFQVRGCALAALGIS